MEQERCEKDKERVEREARVHEDKVHKSTAMFKNTKITSCSHIL